MFPSGQDDLISLKREFEKAIGSGTYNFSDDQLKAIFREIEKLPYNSRTVDNWQTIAQNITGFRHWIITKALDMSDINDIHRRIQGILNR